MKDPSQVGMRGPLEVFASGFAAELQRVGYRRVPIAFQLQLMAHASRWLQGEGLGAHALRTEVVERFLAERRAAGYTNYVTARAMAPLLGYLRGLGVAPAATPLAARGAVEVLLDRYREYLAVERGLTADTIAGYVHAVRPFLSGRAIGDGEPGLHGLEAADVVAFVVAVCPGQSRGAAKMTVTALRSLLGFLHVRGLIDRSLVGAVPSTASWRLSGLPRAARRTSSRRQRRHLRLRSSWRFSCLEWTDFALATLPAGADEAGEPPPQVLRATGVRPDCWRSMIRTS